MGGIPADQSLDPEAFTFIDEIGAGQDHAVGTAERTFEKTAVAAVHLSISFH